MSNINSYVYTKSQDFDTIVFSYVDELLLFMYSPPDICTTCLNSICVWLPTFLKSGSRQKTKIFIRGGNLVCCEVLPQKTKKITPMFSRQDFYSFEEQNERIWIEDNNHSNYNNTKNIELSGEEVIVFNVSRLEQQISKYQNIHMTNNMHTNVDVTFLTMCMNDPMSFQDQCKKFYEHHKYLDEQNELDEYSEYNDDIYMEESRESRESSFVEELELDECSFVEELDEDSFEEMEISNSQYECDFDNVKVI